ncbi:MAG: ssDNA-binding domain-containing protein [Alicyclobacillus sp.]|nr:ssDNA-binding domain-containing protein [Alicyclobacillus sp.]
MDKVQVLVDKLEQGVLAVYSGDKWREVLEVQSRFHNYSFSNVMLILMQCPHASHVAGFNTWKQLGRHVVRGEKAIQILAPMICKKVEINEDGAEVEKSSLYGFRVVNVFDVSQTAGKELPRLTTELDGNSTMATRID